MLVCEVDGQLYSLHAADAGGDGCPRSSALGRRVRLAALASWLGVVLRGNSVDDNVSRVQAGGRRNVCDEREGKSCRIWVGIDFFKGEVAVRKCVCSTELGCVARVDFDSGTVVDSTGMALRRGRSSACGPNPGYTSGVPVLRILPCGLTLQGGLCGTARVPRVGGERELRERHIFTLYWAVVRVHPKDTSFRNAQRLALCPAVPWEVRG